MSDTSLTPPLTGAAATRQRILDAASALFAAHGLRGVSADRVIEAVGTTKVTFYRHFKTKSDLAVAYLSAAAEAERTTLESVVASEADAADALREIAGLIGKVACAPGFRGCQFINAVAESPDPDDPVRLLVAEHRADVLGLFAEIAARAGVPAPDAAAAQLVMLRDGAMVSGYLNDPAQIAPTLEAGFLGVLHTADD